MLAYMIRRLLLAIPTVLGVLLLFFVLFHLINSPANMARQILGEKAGDEQVEQWVKDHGFDQPRFFNVGASGLQKFTRTQSWRFFSKMLTFDFGRSDFDNISIAYKLKSGAIPSLMVTLPAFLIGTVLAIGLSLLVALFRDNYIDRTVLVLCVIGMSLVYFIYIVAGQYYFGRLMKWFPLSGFHRGHMIHFLSLPWLIAIVHSLGRDVRFYRSVMVNEVSQNYVRTARAKGLRNRVILSRHLLKNALVPILTSLVMAIPYLFTGSILLESFFSIPGLGRLTVDSMIAHPDFTTLSAIVFISCLMYVLFNLITDICYAWVDPRVRLN